MGVILPLSGTNAEAAREVLNGMELAKDEINSSGGLSGVKLRLITADSSQKDYAFADAFNAMSREGVKIYNIGFGKETVLLRKTLVGENGIFVNYLCSYPPATLDASNSTRIFINGAQQGDIMAQAVDRKDGLERQIVLMNVDNLAGKSNGDYLAFNLNVQKTKLYKDVFGEGETRFGVFGEQIMRLWTEYVFYVGYGKELPAFLEHLGKIGYKGAVVADCGFYTFADMKIPQNIKFSRVETLFEQGKITSGISRDFRAAYRARYGKEATWVAAYGYDSIKLLSQAALEAKFKPASMRAHFVDKSYDAAIGKLKFDSSADSTSELELVRKK